MKKLLLLFLLLALAALFYFFKPSSTGTMNENDSDFAVNDTSKIDKIFIADKGDNEVVLTRDNNKWLVNGKYKCRPESIELLLTTIKRLKANNPVPNAAYNNIVRGLAGNSKKVEIYSNGKSDPIKTYYIGPTTPKQNGNYMLLEGSKQPYAVGIPGFIGYVSGRYILDENDWRDRTVFAYRPEDVKSVTVQFPQEPQKSFHLAVDNQTNFGLFKLNNQAEQKPIILDKAKALNYLQGFRFLANEAILENYTRKDSLLNSPKAMVLSVEDNKGEKKSIDIYYMPTNRRSKKQFNEDGSRVKYDVDRFYAVMNEGKDFIIIQHYVFGKVLRTYNEMFALKVGE